MSASSSSETAPFPNERFPEQETEYSLAAQGFRFVYQDGTHNWKHAAEIKPGAIDCTDMDDAAFERHVREVCK